MDALYTKNRALTRILKTGVPEPSLPNDGESCHTKEYSLLQKIGVPAQKWEFRTANQQLVRALQRRMDELLYDQGWINCYTKKVDGLLYKEGWLDCCTKKVGKTVS